MSQGLLERSFLLSQVSCQVAVLVALSGVEQSLL